MLSYDQDDHLLSAGQETGYPVEEQTFSDSEREWYWLPLLDSVGPEIAEQFDWKAETGTIQTYEHRETFRYIHIDSVSRNFYDQQCNVISLEAALLHALPPALDAAPDPTVETAVSTFETVSSVETAEALKPIQTEPGLDAFTRKHAPLFGRGAAEDFEGDAMDPSSGRSGGLSGIFSTAKRKILSSRERSSEELGAHAMLLDLNDPREDQEASLSTFTRRRFEFER